MVIICYNMVRHLILLQQMAKIKSVPALFFFTIWFMLFKI